MGSESARKAKDGAAAAVDKGKGRMTQDKDEEEDDSPSTSLDAAVPATPLSLSATLSRGSYHQCGTARRVKVYELKGETWFDRGTGYCAGVYDELNDAALLVTRMEETCCRLELADKEAEHYVLVVSESLDSDDLLLKTRVVKDDVYQRQQDTLVVWTEPDGTDMALSFQEADGCHEVWEFLTEVQKHFLLSARGLEEDEEEFLPEKEELMMSDGSPFALPTPMLNNLHVIDVTLKDAASRSPQARERVSEWILREDFLIKLISTFHDAEELEQLDALHRLCAIMHTIIMLNDSVLVERILRDDLYRHTVGMLEYDPEFPHLKASYRDYLSKTRFRQVVAMPEEMTKKIHQTFRLQYLKDVILARTLDDSTFAVLNSLIFYHQADIVTFCTSNVNFLSSLFQLFVQQEEDKKAEAILLLQQLCATGKQVQLPSRLALYRALTEKGLLSVIEYAFTLQNLQTAAAEILMSIIEYDASGVRVHILDQVRDGKESLLRKLAEILHADGDLGLKTQITESLRILFDCGPDGLQQQQQQQQSQQLLEANDEKKDENEKFLNWLYDGEIDHLFAPLRKNAVMVSHLCELLTFVIIHHHFRSQHWVISSNIGVCVAALLHAREKHLKLNALRFFRACLARGNQFINKHFVQIDLLNFVLCVVEAEALRDNLVTSACLEFFEHIRKEPVKPLVDHLMDKHEARVRALTRHRTIGHYFQAMILQWEKSEKVQQQAMPPPPPSHVKQEQSLSAEEDEENYFFKDEEEIPMSSSKGRPRSNTGANAATASDQDDEDEGETGDLSNTLSVDESVDIAREAAKVNAKRKQREEEEDEGESMERLVRRKSVAMDDCNDEEDEDDEKKKKLSINVSTSTMERFSSDHDHDRDVQQDPSTE